MFLSFISCFGLGRLGSTGSSRQNIFFIVLVLVRPEVSFPSFFLSVCKSLF